ncbi:TIGR02281 family clan AA aspartic protease [Hyphomicrobium methylovorum]|uniref:retropepsin-like aspartic protease family protein n=1 Tax=Hyphomicrobium methylovorum TaxID=84 RepID=UPI0015E78152|nr:TIGR02281 family clan AA aspartic protease [Hyphomicrobium methylovorum]MBA2124881.1 TIGR02281 family clan AA aspartic protease [Hyphomicrobium methylovorum]
MSSATSSLFVSVALAAIGATGLAYTLAHPGILARVLTPVSERTMQAPATVDGGEVGEDDSSASRPGQLPGSAVIQAGAYGHFDTDAEINGRSVPVMVDTGASLVALTYEDAARLGIFLKPRDFSHTAKTANGLARVASITLDRISIGDITVRRVPAVVSEQGKSEKTLLGMSFLGRLSSVEMRSGTLVLQE